MRPAARLAAALAMLWPSASGLAAAEQRFGLGGGWRLERFEGDIVILRTTVSDPSSRRRGVLLLSCAGAQRRLQIVLPTRAGAGAAATRWALFKPVGPPAPADTPLVARLSLEGGRRLSFSEIDAGPRSVVLGVAELLRRKPPVLEMLTHDGATAVSLRAVVPYVFALTFEPRDDIALEHFAVACRPVAR